MLWVVAPQALRILEQRQQVLLHNPPTVLPQRCPQCYPQGFHRLSTFRTQWAALTLQGDSEHSQDAQGLGTNRHSAGDNHGDNRAQLWMDRGTGKVVHRRPEPSTDPSQGDSTAPHRPGPAKTRLVHTIHNPYYYCFS
jgi:hypothetical protein